MWLHRCKSSPLDLADGGTGAIAESKGDREGNASMFSPTVGATPTSQRAVEGWALPHRGNYPLAPMLCTDVQFHTAAG